jgi:hypothetical protein
LAVKKNKRGRGNKRGGRRTFTSGSAKKYPPKAAVLASYFKGNNKLQRAANSILSQQCPLKTLLKTLVKGNKVAEELLKRLLEEWAKHHRVDSNTLMIPERVYYNSSWPKGGGQSTDDLKVKLGKHMAAGRLGPTEWGPSFTEPRVAFNPDHCGTTPDDLARLERVCEWVMKQSTEDEAVRLHVHGRNKKYRRYSKKE